MAFFGDLVELGCHMNTNAWARLSDSTVSVIGMQELTRKANELVVTEYRPLEIYTILVLEYLVLILIVSAGVRWLERRMNAAY